MITEYHRPDKLEDALDLLARTNPLTVPLGGGTVLNQPSDQQVAVVDLQALGLNLIEPRGRTLSIGATVTLQALLDASKTPLVLKAAIRHEATYNIRQVATVAGALMAADGRSPFAAAILALAPELTLQPGDEKVSYGELLPLRAEQMPGRLITYVAIPLDVKLAYQYVARSPADLPIVCAAVAKWPSGRTRVVLGGYGESPLLAMDGPNPQGADIAARDAYREAGDQWASAEYRSDVAAKLTRRCIDEFEN
ncbi:MAG: FAD binding domain-containing protein [Anaerolineales bacterium]|nr:FAD binding domain-containing protein [Anaerolineales bacterium]